jgi:cyclase
MKRNLIHVLGLLMLASTGAFAQQPDFSKVEIQASKVAGNVYLLEGAGGNIAASVGTDGIVIVDDQFAPLADKIRAALKGITDQPVRFVINTHYHGDHTGGNAEFSKHATVIAHENVRKRLASGGVGGNGGSYRFQSNPAAKDALPVITFRHDVTVHFNGEDIRALYAPAGHTDGDCFVYFPQSNVVHMGDNFVTYGFPFIDLHSGGSSRGMAEALEKALAELPADVKIIPGHGPVSTPDDVRRFIAMLNETRSAVESALAGGKSLEQLQREKVLAPWQKYSGPFIDTDHFIETLYNELTGRPVSALVNH